MDRPHLYNQQAAPPSPSGYSGVFSVSFQANIPTSLLPGSLFLGLLECRSSTWMFPKIGGKTPKWMVKIMENPIKMGWFGGTPIFGNTHINSHTFGFKTCDTWNWWHLITFPTKLLQNYPSRSLQHVPSQPAPSLTNPWPWLVFKKRTTHHHGHGELKLQKHRHFRM